mmetsp:Transcript_77200/g.221912  ORF Transcript_77200/g.221912 Transcript_77200/m.221912 type:complete len:345 (-) Transcript_77200:536-1570(-)
MDPTLWADSRVPKHLSPDEVKDYVRLEFLNAPRPPPGVPAVVAAMGTIPGMWAICIVPTMLGLIKAEYAVSYGYGWAMAGLGLATLLNAPIVATPSLCFGLDMITRQHALLYVLFGLRLNSFLAFRSNLPVFKKLVQTIEDKRNANAPEGFVMNRLSRLPFILSCSALYFGMGAPLYLTKMYGASIVQGSALWMTAKAGVVAMYTGFVLEAVGDYQKLREKSKTDGLVTKGLYRYLRHPNYSGEQLLWLGSCITGLASCAAAAVEGGLTRGMLKWVAGTVFGFAGIQYVLMQATTTLEKKQSVKYATNPDYQSWVQKTWGGFTFAPTQQVDDPSRSQNNTKAGP